MLKNAYLFLIVFFTVILASCENDLKEVERVSGSDFSLPIDTTRGVSVLYSDSAVVKGKLITPLLTHHQTKNEYEMSKGLTIIFFDENLKETSRVVADYGIRHENEHQVELRKNVVVTNQKGDVYKSEELIYDEGKKLFYSNQLVHIIGHDGTDVFGTGLKSDQNFDNPIIDHMYGKLMTGDKLNTGQP